MSPAGEGEVPAQGPWYWCLEHSRVEGEQGCANDMRMGPYDKLADAQTALERAHERSAAWDSQDDDWRR